MAPRRSASSPLALAVLALLAERPMHPYEIASEMRTRGIEQSVKLNYGSLYTTVDALRDAGLIEPHETVQEGRRPQRTVYRMTEPGRDELDDRLTVLLGEAEREFPRFAAGLAFLQRVPRDEVVGLLGRRADELEGRILAMEAVVESLVKRGMPRMAVIEDEYQVALWRTDLEWTRRLADDLASGVLPYPTRDQYEAVRSHPLASVEENDA